MTAPRPPHQPVLLEEVIELLAVRPDGRYIDGTLGAGGHTAAILEREPTAQVLGIDRDDRALGEAVGRLTPYSDRVMLQRGEYVEMGEIAAAIGWDGCDGILLDLGVSSMQLDEADRGFSFQADGPLDMRMDRRQRMTAATLVSTLSADELAQVFREDADEPQAWRIAQAIAKRAEQLPWERTGELAACIRDSVNWAQPKRCPAVVRCFQALRIMVNNELEALQETMSDVVIPLLNPGGRLVVISFHSLEDKIVKDTLRAAAATCICPPRMPLCACGKQQELRILTRKVVRSSEEERDRNRRASCARLRAAEKCELKEV